MLGCSRCGSRALRCIRSRRWSRRLLAWLGFEWVECRDCGQRGMQSLWMFSQLGYARCPECFSLELSSWSERRVRPTWGQTLKIALGGRPLRCPRCRRNFVSFRPVRKPVSVPRS